MLKVTNLTKHFGTERVLNKISFNIEQNQRIALVGFNGTGKSTLLKILSGELKADSGKIEFGKNVSIGFLPQDTDSYNKENVLKYIENYVGQNTEVFYRNVEIMFAGFALPSEVKFKKIGELSSGQKTKVFLTAILLKKPNIMLLDEPTNNLDLPALIWLEDFLQKTSSTFIVVSHDKKFLNNVANKIYELDWKERTIEISNGKYLDYLIRKEKEKSRQLQQHLLQKEDKLRLTRVAEAKQEKARIGAKMKGPDNDRLLRGYRRDKAGDSYRDSKVIFARIKRMEKIEKPNERNEFKIEINAENSEFSRDILTRELFCGYGSEFKIGPIDLDVRFGNRITILGLNGSGKSTLLKTLTGRIKKIVGEIYIGEGVKFGNLMQEHESLPKEETLINFLTKRIELDKSILQNHLLHFGFGEWQVKTKIKELSPGGRARLLLAFFATSSVNTLILDEPTNHLDMEAGEALDKALGKFEGTVITATHDRFFVEKNKTDVLYVLDNGVLNKINNFGEYVAEMEKRARKLLRMLVR